MKIHKSKINITLMELMEWSDAVSKDTKRPEECRIKFAESVNNFAQIIFDKQVGEYYNLSIKNIIVIKIVNWLIKLNNKINNK